MRRTLALVLASMLMTGGACASSFVVIAPPKSGDTASILTLSDSPSIVAIGEPVAAKTADAATGEGAIVVPLAYPLPEGSITRVQISASIIAFSSPIPNVAYEKVAAISPDKPKKKHSPFSTPVVMRGGIIGDTYGASPTPASLPSSSGGNSGQQSARATAASRKNSGKAPAEPAPVVVAPPPPNLPKLNGVE